MGERHGPYQPSAGEGRERLVTVGRQPEDERQARAWLAQLDREVVSIEQQLAIPRDVLEERPGIAGAPGGYEGWRKRARGAREVKAAEIERLEGWLRRHTASTLGTLDDAAGARTVTPADLDRWEDAIFEGPASAPGRGGRR